MKKKKDRNPGEGEGKGKGKYKGPKTPGAVYKHRRFWIGYEAPPAFEYSQNRQISLYLEEGSFSTLEQAKRKAETLGIAGTYNTIFEDFQVWLRGEHVGGTPYRAVAKVRVRA